MVGGSPTAVGRLFCTLPQRRSNREDGVIKEHPNQRTPLPLHPVIEQQACPVVLCYKCSVAVSAHGSPPLVGMCQPNTKQS